jgi:hypothetical protein
MIEYATNPNTSANGKMNRNESLNDRNGIFPFRYMECHTVFAPDGQMPARKRNKVRWMGREKSTNGDLIFIPLSVCCSCCSRNGEGMQLIEIRRTAFIFE